MHKKRNTIMAVLAVVLVAALTIGGTLAYMTDSQSLTNTFRVGDLDITFKEPNYPDGECNDRVPGDSFPKDPTVKAVKGDAYLRVKVEFVDAATGAPISGERLDLIQQTIYYDPNFSATVVEGGYKGSSNLRVWAGTLNTHTPNANFHYTQAQLAGKVGSGVIQNWFNSTNFDAPAQVVSPGVFYLNYKGIFVQGAEVQLFTSIVFPSDWNQIQLQKIGNYAIKMTAEVIQAAGFADRAEAFTALNAETILVNYGAT